MNVCRIFALWALPFVLTACSGEKPADAEHGHGEGGLKVTHFSDATELFVEFPQLVVGRDAAFAAHLTRLADFKPVDAGRVTVVLAGGGAPEERFGVDAPTQPGIFRPVAKPTHPGKRTLALLLESPGLAATHPLGPVTVFADEAAAARAAQGNQAKGDEGIPFLKEQQWKVDFATTPATTRAERASVAATGVLRAHPDGEALVTAPAAGRISTAVRFPHAGVQVERGEILVWLAPRLGGETDVATLDAALRKARVAVELARRERERLEALHAQEAVAEKRVIAVRADEKLAQADLEAAERRLGQLQGRGGGIAVRAPISGAIADVKASAGAFVNEGQLLFHVASIDRLWLEARIPESEVGRLTHPVGAWFKPDGFERGFDLRIGENARLVAFGGIVDPATRTVPLVIEFANPDHRLRIGMGVKVQVFAEESRDTVAIPASAVLDESGLAVVYVQKDGESFERRQIELGPRDGEWAAVKSGLSAGERVVSRGAYLVRLAGLSPATASHGHGH